MSGIGAQAVSQEQPADGYVAALRENRRLIWVLSLGAFGLAWSITTVAAYLPSILETFTNSAVLVGFVLAAEGGFAIVLPLVVGPLSDATRTPFGRRRPYMAFACKIVVRPDRKSGLGAIITRADNLYERLACPRKRYWAGLHRSLGKETQNGLWLRRHSERP